MLIAIREIYIIAVNNTTVNCEIGSKWRLLSDKYQSGTEMNAYTIGL